MTPEHEQYRRRKAEQEAKYKSQFRERWFAWWRNPPDRFAALIAVFTALLFAATAGLWIATKDLVDDAKSSGRAWIGPMDASMPSPPQPERPIKVIVSFGNSGRQPALYNSGMIPKIFTLDEWTNGSAADSIVKYQETCMKVKEIVKPIARVAYPTSGFSSFQTTYDAASKGMSEAEKIKGTQKLVDGDEIFTLRGCFVYQTAESVHHSSFCYFYQGGVSDAQHLNFCTVGHDSD